MTTNTLLTLERILGAERSEAPSADPRNNKIAKEFLRRSALWAGRLECVSDWPFFDIARAIGPDIEIDRAVDEKLRAHLRGPGKVGPLMSRLLLWSLRWAEVKDTGRFQFEALPDPYEPILSLYEQGGEISTHHGTILTPINGFRLMDFEHYVVQPSRSWM